jgi:hypothetical protein
MALKGTLKDFSLADIFQLIGIQKKTGVLTLKNDKEVVTVSFVEGNVVTADALHRRLEDRIGTVLVKSGRITEAQLQETLRIQKNTLKRMGNILVESSFIDAVALREALQVQISQMVYRLFRWRDGEYDFSQDERVDYDEEHVVPMSAESILMEGARILDEWPMIEKAIRSFATVFRRANVEIARPGRETGLAGEEGPAAGVTLNEQERMIFSLVDGRRPVQEIVERSTLSEFDTCRILFELIGRHLLEEVKGSGAKAAPAVVAPGRAAPAASLLLVGIGYVVLIAALGAALTVRSRTWSRSTEDRSGQGLLAGALFRTPTIDSLHVSVRASRLQRIDFALQVYYLLKRGYPESLRDLVTCNFHLLKPEAITDESGAEYPYRVVPGGYELSCATCPPPLINEGVSMAAVRF